MATDLKAKLVTVSYQGGTATAPYGTIEKIFPNLKPNWSPKLKPSVGRRRLLYGQRQRNISQAGYDIVVRLDGFGDWVIRVTGAYVDFITQILAKAPPGLVLQAYTERGTIYGAQYIDLDSTTP